MVSTRATSKASKEILSENFKLKQEIARLKSQVASLKDSLREARTDAESLRAAQREAQREASIKLETERQAHSMQIQNLEDKGKRLIDDCTMGVSSMVRGFETLKKKVRATCDLVKSAVESSTAAAVDNACTEFVKNVTEPVTEINKVCEGFRRIGAALPTCHRCDNRLNEQRITQSNTTPPTTPKEAPSSKICFGQFSEQPGQVPRILRCGHTLCEECTGKMKNGKEVMCPFDRIPTLLLSHNLAYLPKNFSILDMCEQE